MTRFGPRLLRPRRAAKSGKGLASRRAVSRGGADNAQGEMGRRMLCNGKDGVENTMGKLGGEYYGKDGAENVM